MELSRKERQKLEKRRRQEEKLARHKKEKQVKLLKIAFAMIFIVAAYFMYNSFFDYSGKGMLKPGKESYNFGPVSTSGDVVSVEIPLVNIGEGDLTINYLDTSCGCTEASIIQGEEESPLFQMRGHRANDNINWETTIPSGGQATLKIYYDPAVHQDLRGSVTRQIWIYTDDPKKSVHEIRIQVNQVD